MKKRYEKPDIIEEVELSMLYASGEASADSYQAMGWDMCEACGEDPNPQS